MSSNPNTPTTKRQRLEREAATRYEPAVRTSDDGSHYGVVYETENHDAGEVWYGRATYATRDLAFVAACAKADELADLWADDQAHQEDLGNDCPNCGGSGGGPEHYRCHICAGSGRRRQARPERDRDDSFFHFATGMARAQAEFIATGGERREETTNG